MALIVQKYGGTSVASPERIQAVAKRVAHWHRQGHQLVVVASAMAGVTDSLIKLACAVCEEPSERELDVLLATGEQTSIALLSMALHHLGVPAISLTGAQAGIVTDGVHTRAKIANITPHTIRQYLTAGHAVIVAGFQGQTMEGQVTTLGRGGSDLTAIALATVLKADVCQIYTDVDGVYTADPRLVPEARKLREISYEAMLEMASLGSRVMQARSVEFAKKFKVAFEVRSSFNDMEGTVIKEKKWPMEEKIVHSVSLEKNQIQVKLLHLPDPLASLAAVMDMLAQAHISIDMIVQHSCQEGRAVDVSFTLHKDDQSRARKALQSYLHATPKASLAMEENLAKVSVIGMGMRSQSAVMAKLLHAIAQEKISIYLITTSEIRLTLLIDEAKAIDAMRAAHRAFDLHKEA